MTLELYNLLNKIEDRTFLILNPFIVYGVEVDTTWRARCVGIVRVRPDVYNVILQNNAQFYRPLKRTGFVFQRALETHIRLTMLGRVLLGKQKRYFIY